MLFDSHCHLTDTRLLPEVDDVIDRARKNGVDRIVTVGADLDDWGTTLDIARRFGAVHAALGVHPHIADRATDEAMARLEELARGESSCVAIGETGLDYYYDNAPRDAQREAFLRHLALAESVGLPVIVHTRSADEDTIAILREAGRNVRGVIHCFTGGRALMEAALDLGWYISLAGIVGFRNYEDQDLVRAIPADRLLIETDSPYLAPVPMRGKRNEPAFVRHVAEAVARIRGEDFEVVARRTTDNARAFYRI